MTGALNERLRQMGLGSRYLDGRSFSAASDSELSARAVLLNHLDQILGESAPNSRNEMAKAGVIRELIGDNRNASVLVGILRLWRSESAEALVARGRVRERVERAVRRNQALFEPLSRPASDR